MKLREIKNIFKTSLNKLYDADESSAITRNVLMEVLNLSAQNLLLKDQEDIKIDQEKRLMQILDRLKQSEPMQYVLGYAWFCDLKLKVNKHVLIPRPETEELVEWIVSENTIQAPSILDIGTGSGCIAIALAKKNNGATVSAMDISSNALETAFQNAEMNNVSIQFWEEDILKPKESNRTYDIIVSNPPYVLNAEKESLQRHVIKYEPHTALFVPDNDPLLFYKAIIDYAKKQLKPGGKLFFEIHEEKGEEIKQFLISNKYKAVTIKKDISNKVRMVSGVK